MINDFSYIRANVKKKLHSDSIVTAQKIKKSPDQKDS